MVLARIRSTNSSDTFVYHSGNVCYEPYIFSKTKTQHEDENVEDHEGDMMVDIGDVHLGSLQASGTLTEKLSSRKNIREIKCVIYDKFIKSKIYNKHRLEVDSWKEKFLKMPKGQIDDAFNPVPDCTDVHRLYGADLYYYITCMRNCVQKTQSVNNSDDMGNSNEVKEYIVPVKNWKRLWHHGYQPSH